MEVTAFVPADDEVDFLVETGVTTGAGFLYSGHGSVVPLLWLRMGSLGCGRAFALWQWYSPVDRPHLGQFVRQVWQP